MASIPVYVGLDYHDEAIEVHEMAEVDTQTLPFARGVAVGRLW